MSEIVRIDKLISDNVLPPDSKVLSEHNNTVVMSEHVQIVARIALQKAMHERDDPGDLVYSHRLSWNLGSAAGVVSPIEREPIVHHGTVISIYPLMLPVDWNRISAEQMSQTIGMFNTAAVDKPSLRVMDIEDYAERRINYAESSEVGQYPYVEIVRHAFDMYRKSYPFQQLIDDSPSLVHGDLHTGNIVTDENYKPLLIDLDSAAIGPAHYDIASWHVRNARGDNAPTDAMTDILRRDIGWDEESFRALMGWKVVSSLTHTVRYEMSDKQRDTIRHLFRIARQLGAAGDWRDIHVTS